jgi:hypothetical protein
MLGLTNRLSFSLGGANAGAAILSETRNFTTSNLAGSEYWPLDSSVSLTGNFSITTKVSTTSTAAGVLYSGGTASGKLEVSLTAAGLVQVDVAGITIFTGVIAVNDGKFNTLVLSRTNTTASLTVNDTADGSGTMSGTVAFDTLQARTSGSVFFIGFQSDIIVNDAGTNVHSWPIDEEDPSTITDRIGSNDSTAVNFTSADSEKFTLDGINWIGSVDHVVNGSFDTDSNWTKGTGWTISGGQAHHAAGTRSTLYQNVTGLNEGDLIRVIHDVVSGTNNAGIISQGVGGGTAAFGNPPSTKNIADISYGGINNQLKFDAFSANDLSIDNIKLFKRLEIAS